MIFPKVAYLRTLLTEVKRVRHFTWNLAKLSSPSSPSGCSSVDPQRLLSPRLRASRYLPRPSASSPLDNKAPSMANTSQLLAVANPQPRPAPPVPDIERSRHSSRSRSRSNNPSIERARRRHRAQSPSLHESSSSESSKTTATEGEEARRGRSPHIGDRIRARNKSTSQKIRDLDAQLDTINSGTNAPVTVDTLIRQTEPPFTERILRARISSKFKLPAQLGIYEGKTDPMDHLDSYKSLMSLQGCSDEQPQNAGDDIEVLRDEVGQLTLTDPRDTTNTKPLEEVVPIFIHPEYPDRHVLIGAELTNELRFALINFLKKNSDVFAWSQGDVPGIDPKIAMHKLFTNPKHPPVRQKRRKFAPEQLKVIEDEVNKLIRANVVREAHYLDWLANVVVAPQKGGKWRVCVDFTDLNKACPKDSFPLPKIDLVVDATSKHELLSFMDAFSGYHHIKMYPPDIEKTSFITERGLYCYKVMPFGLKNTGTTYQRLVNKMFKEQIGKTMEVYIDDMLVKSLRAHNHVAHLEEAFDILRRHRMMLNPSKCIF
ncbi:uncharacterized protein LOC130768891 [Actinidia eriantha]|uniref:uncharacterized protein LOC130768891 n=1 Tax=Actinidia eriantha TaxID=165200 RepID=UPI00258D66C9|nr:uncharacterized protein LOC130768891 [Actinidia eriantha]